MRLAVKATIVLLISYTLFVSAIGFWLERSVRALSKNLTKNAARLLANDVAAAITLPVLEQLQRADSAARERLEAIIDDVTQRSEVVASLTVVDAAGRVVAGDEAEPGQKLAAPAEVFTSGGAPELVSPRFQFQAGAYYLYVPLVGQGRILGYLRLVLTSPPLVSIYYRSREEFFLLAGAGFVFVLLLGLALQIQLSRRGARLAETVHEALRNPRREIDPGGEDLVAAVDVARREGARTAAAQARAAEAERQRDALAQVADTGVILLGLDKSLEFANAAARRLFGCPRDGELESRWSELGARLARHWEEAGFDEDGVGIVELELTSPARRLRCRISDFDSDAAGGSLVVAHDATVARALDEELGRAVEMTALAAFCNAAGAELRRASAAASGALDGLRNPLREAEPADAAARRLELVENLARQLDRIDRELETLLLYTGPEEPRESIELGELVEDVLGLVEPAARARQVELEPRIPGESLFWTGSRRHFTQALLNLVLCGLDGQPPGRALRVDLDCQAAHAVLSVGDPGGLGDVEEGDEPDAPVVLDGAGEARLGLRVARAFAAAAGGRLEGGRRGDGAISCRLWLPLGGSRGRAARAE